MQTTTRRSFLRNTLLASGALLAPPRDMTHFSVPPENPRPLSTRISGVKVPLAIAMWDFSWILRHHRYGEFEDWDRVLEGLRERGYNAIRIDAMPQFVAAGTDGKLIKEFRSVKENWIPALWGNDYTMTFNPREALLEFLPKCRKYGVKVGIASWFMRHGTARENIFMEEGGLKRAWRETLEFLKKHELLDDVLYVDLLNEYPFWHGYDWFKNEMNARSEIQKFALDNPDANVPDAGAASGSNPLQQQFYNDFVHDLIYSLKSEYPDMDFFASLDSGMDLRKIDLSHFNALDYHVWFAHSGRIPGLDKISSRDLSRDQRKIYSDITTYWEENKSDLIDWMDSRITDISTTAAANHIVCGNTEGWGPIWWYDHTELDWKWVKETADICVDMALRHDNYKFICTSNFTHPQFKGMWEDIQWHRQITSRIKRE